MIRRQLPALRTLEPKLLPSLVILAGVGITMLFAASQAAAATNNGNATAAENGHPYGWLSLVPPLVAIGLAIATTRVFSSLLIGIASGALILSQGRFVDTITSTCETFLWTSLIDEEHLRVFAFTSLMGAMVGVMHASGGIHGLVDRLIIWAHNRRAAQLTCWGLGLVVFFDDYANTLLLGGTLRPLTDRLKISREKLAYLVDSTAAPVAGLAVVSTWVAGEVGYIESGLNALGQPFETSAFEVFVATIPYRFYPLLALLLVATIGMTGRDFGPMLRAERRATRGHVVEPDDALAGGLPDPPVNAPRRWELAVIPVLVCVGGIACLLWWTGDQTLPPGQPRTLLSVLGASDSFLALVYGSLAGLLVAILLSRLGGVLSMREIQQASGHGALAMLPAMVVLWLAWSLADVTGPDHLATGPYLAALVEGYLPGEWLPTVVFLLAAATAFSTGTSWGTMGILLPLVIPVTAGVLEAQGTPVDAEQPLLLASVAGVLAGAVFGDHCSPISDTTVLSSRASGCDHIAHVRTQLPYALLVGTITILFGTIPIGFGLPVWPALVLGSVAVVIAVRLIGKPLEAPTT